LLGLAAVLAWYGPYDAHETNSIAKASPAMLEDRALRFRIRVCARIFRPRQLLMKTAPGTQAQILASWSGNQLDLSLICRRRRTLEIPASTAANEPVATIQQSSHVRAPTNKIRRQRWFIRPTRFF
jgi:hypothetical protein